MNGFTSWHNMYEFTSVQGVQVVVYRELARSLKEIKKLPFLKDAICLDLHQNYSHSIYFNI